MSPKTPASQLEGLKAAIKIQTDNINPSLFGKLKDLFNKLTSHDKEYKHHDIALNSSARHSKEHKHPESARKSHTHPEYKNVDSSKQLAKQDKAIAVLVADVKNLSVERERTSVAIAPILSDWEFTVTQRTSNDRIYKVRAERV